MNLPHDFEIMYRKVFGETAWFAYLDGYSDRPWRALRVNPKRPICAELYPLLHTPVPWAKDAYMIENDLPLGGDPLHAGGLFYLQEPSAMAPVAALHPVAGESILDLCAAPGGKTTQIAAAMNDRGILVANEIHRERCLALAENTERMGLSSTCVTNLEPHALIPYFEQFFDAVLVDAPCSGEGMFRKDPQSIAQWNEHLPEHNATRQLDILDSAYQMTKPGGRIVYSTCTFNPIENETVLLRFIAEHQDVRLVPLMLPEALPGLSIDQLRSLANEQWPLLEDTLQLVGNDDLARCDTTRSNRYFPYSSNGEGHFVALIEKQISSCAPSQHIGTAHGKKRSLKKRTASAQQQEVIELFTDFACATLSKTYWRKLQETHTLALHGEILYAVPHNLPQTVPFAHGILRKGLPLCTARNHHIVPSHALALALTAHDVQRELQLSYGDIRVLNYLRGETLSVDESNGYLLVTVDGVPQGFGKVVDGILKNHMPKGLRKKYTFVLPH
ncbi:MAG: RsmB/NOP family class I SAM-dependent RNA methyltransferase [Acidibacillus sp.]|uniref:Ribosomal RNA small subunit methyltransferase F n=1 Tax=Sulfoacidibacillus ferrooxidans TaxID=2005001 RepID=A0A9X1V8C8_9BACL|nr:RsmF rRNA methyltransferase first C-terminal domain-containing protein [Sulfoacidibacillus ferrooxidans]MCI0181948.1 Ribosomal RNA small subunit methyltransferase F [Sulfoacidibacillus ferrooxidans]MCY0893390.1 RsmB/NOP family class I SAM-dependent RNA methyltransferase [Acidibacillus sp.]